MLSEKRVTHNIGHGRILISFKEEVRGESNNLIEHEPSVQITSQDKSGYNASREKDFKEMLIFLKKKYEELFGKKIQ
jgi:hypothetical protein